MSQRLLDNTKWFWCVLALHVGSLWGPVRSITVRTPPSNPSTIEAQAKFFQDFFSVQLSPYKIEFGHVCEDPNTWEQRYEKKDYKNHRDMGKVRWGDKKGGYGEHYWDLNHAGHSDNHGDDGYEGDDGSYHENSDPYDEHNDHSPTYGTEEYDSEKSSYDESGRAKRAHPKVKIERKRQRIADIQEEVPKPLKQKLNKSEKLQTAATDQDEQYVDDEEEVYEQPKPKRQQYRKKEETKTTQQQPKERNKLVLVVTHKDEAEKRAQSPPQYGSKQPDHQQYGSKQPDHQQYGSKQPDHQQYSSKQPDHQQYGFKQPEHQQYVPYEGGSGVRQHQQPEVSAASNIPRLFLEPSTGHVVDRATGQAYVLQPVARNNYN